MEGVLGVEDQSGQVGQDAQRRNAATGLQLFHGVAEECGVAPEHVDDEGPDASAQVLGQHGNGAEEMGEDAAPVYVADDDGGEAGDRKSTRLNSSHLGISYAVF